MCPDFDFLDQEGFIEQRDSGLLIMKPHIILKEVDTNKGGELLSLK